MINEQDYVGNADHLTPLGSGRKEMLLFNHTLNTLCLQSYSTGHSVKDHSNNERGNLLLFPISIKESFICTTKMC